MKKTGLVIAYVLSSVVYGDVVDRLNEFEGTYELTSQGTNCSEEMIDVSLEDDSRELNILFFQTDSDRRWGITHSFPNINRGRYLEPDDFGTWSATKSTLETGRFDELRLISKTSSCHGIFRPFAICEKYKLNTVVVFDEDLIEIEFYDRHPGHENRCIYSRVVN